MKLRSIKLTNFRCFDNLEVPLHERLTVLVGNNGAGKTAVLDAIGYALARVLTRLPSVGGKDLREDDIRIVRKKVFAPYARIEAKSLSGISWARTLKRDPTRQTNEQIPEAVGDKDLFEYLDPIIHEIAEGKDADLPVFTYYGVSRAVLDVPQRRRGFKKEFSRFHALENALEPTSRFKELFEWFYAKERDEFEQVMATLKSEAFTQWHHNANRARSAGEPIPKPPAFPKSLRVLDAVRRSVNEVIPGYSSPMIRTEPLRLVLTRKLLDGAEQELSLQMLSDGYRTMIAMAMDFARRMAQANPHLTDPLSAEATLIIDEVDLHLHPRWQQTVIPTLQRAFPNAQLIVTTHSPQVLTTVHPENILILENNQLRSCPVPTFGARSSDLVEAILGLEDARPPNNEITERIVRLFDAIDAGDVSNAKSIRESLRGWQQGLPEPDLARADLLIRQLEARNGKNEAHQ